MSLPPTRRAASYVVQALIAGRVRNGLTIAPPGAPPEFVPDQPPPGPLSVRLLDRDADAPYPLPGRVVSGGAFVFYGRPETAFPLLATRTYRLRVEAEAPDFPPQGVDFTLGPLPGQPSFATRPEVPAALPAIPSPTEVLVLPAPLPLLRPDGQPLPEIVVDLLPNPVRLRGRAVKSDDPAVGVEGTVELYEGDDPPAAGAVPAATAPSDAAGRFEFPNPLPLTRAVTLRVVTAGGTGEPLVYRPDYGRPVNEVAVPYKQP